MFKIKVLLLSVLASVLIIGCSNTTNGSETPEDAITQIHLNDEYAPEIIETFELVEISPNRFFGVYKGLLEDEEDVFIGNIEKEEGEGWHVTHATNIGMPSHDRLNQSSSTEKFQAGYKETSEEANDNLIIVELDDDDLEIWIELL